MVEILKTGRERKVPVLNGSIEPASGLTSVRGSSERHCSSEHTHREVEKARSSANLQSNSLVEGMILESFRGRDGSVGYADTVAAQSSYSTQSHMLLGARRPSPLVSRERKRLMFSS